MATSDTTCSSARLTQKPPVAPGMAIAEYLPTSSADIRWRDWLGRRRSRCVGAARFPGRFGMPDPSGRGQPEMQDPQAVQRIRNHHDDQAVAA